MLNTTNCMRSLCVLFGLEPLDPGFMILELIRMASQLTGAVRFLIEKRRARLDRLFATNLGDGQLCKVLFGTVY